MSKIEFWMIRHTTSILTFCVSGLTICAILLSAILLPAPYGQESELDKQIAYLEHHAPHFASQIPTIGDVGNVAKQAAENYFILVSNLGATVAEAADNAADTITPASLDISFFPGQPAEPTGCN